MSPKTPGRGLAGLRWLDSSHPCVARSHSCVAHVALVSVGGCWDRSPQGEPPAWCVARDAGPGPYRWGRFALGWSPMHFRDRSRRRRAFNLPGHAHELTFTRYRRLPFLKAELTCAWLAESLAEARRTLDFSLWAFVFRSEYVHVIVRLDRPGHEMADGSRKATVLKLGVSAENHSPTTPDFNTVPFLPAERGPRAFACGNGIKKCVLLENELMARYLRPGGPPSTGLTQSLTLVPSPGRVFRAIVPR